jgi:hypothetical protein
MNAPVGAAAMCMDTNTLEALPPHPFAILRVTLRNTNAFMINDKATQINDGIIRLVGISWPRRNRVGVLQSRDIRRVNNA